MPSSTSFANVGINCHDAASPGPTTAAAQHAHGRPRRREVSPKTIDAYIRSGISPNSFPSPKLVHRVVDQLRKHTNGRPAIPFATAAPALLLSAPALLRLPQLELQQRHLHNFSPRSKNRDRQQTRLCWKAGGQRGGNESHIHTDVRMAW